MSVAFEVKTAALGPRIITLIGRAPFFVTEPSLFYEHPGDLLVGIAPQMRADTVKQVEGDRAPQGVAADSINYHESEV